MLRVFTIGFTEKSAERFFSLLEESGATHLVDVRLNNRSQLAGFAKQDDLRFFLKRMLDMNYTHLDLLAPTQAMLDSYKKQKGSWGDYEREFLGLMKARQIESSVPPALLANGCLLCSEHLPDQCHRRLVLDYLKAFWPELEVVHLK